MAMLWIDPAVIVVLGLILIRHGKDRRIGQVQLAHWLRIAGVVLFGLGALLAGDMPILGIPLLQWALSAWIGLLVWLRPLEGGLALIAAAALEAVMLVTPFSSGGQGMISSPGLLLLIMVFPRALAGALLFGAGWLARRTRASGLHRHRGSD